MAILLAVIAAMGGHFVEAKSTMCTHRRECTGDCMFTFFVQINGSWSQINTSSRSKGVCQEDLDRLAALESAEGRALSNQFGVACQNYQSRRVDDCGEINNCLYKASCLYR
eukprot:GHVS01101106.1.p1 GENE.GHVS01101106.1~~GHVS01101106.1.p1  ORF type:complete len:130 (+),score=14.67 GHVS01101106.1:60-392(+)